jgi:hypothetical protein
MPQLTIPKSTLPDRGKIPSGFAQVIFGGFQPKLSKKKDENKAQSVNLNPILKIINDARTDSNGNPVNGSRVFDNLNVNFSQRIIDFFHAFGVEVLDSSGGVTLPGEWSGDISDPTKPELWGSYLGPVNGSAGIAPNKVATLELAEVQAYGRPAGETRTEVKRYLCTVNNCNVRHSESLLSK